MKGGRVQRWGDRKSRVEDAKVLGLTARGCSAECVSGRIIGAQELYLKVERGV